MAKRSPILGYNHNVKYRGLVFHVQTEDSGVLSPHLFTHLFYEGVIVSTRKLVYDAGASEDAIKALMQAQHKAVLKDLKQRAFDEKIDAYLGGTPGLEPSEGPPVGKLKEKPRASEPEITLEPVDRTEPEPRIDLAEPEVKPARAKRKSAAPPVDPQTTARGLEPARAKVATPAKPAEPAPEPAANPSPPRTQTAERTSRASQFRSIPPPQPPPPQDLDPPTLSDAAVLAVQGAATVPNIAPPVHTPAPQRPTPTRAATPPPIPGVRSKAHIPVSLDSSPEIQILPYEGETESSRTRTSRDTAVDDAIPSAMPADATVPSDGVPTRPSDSVPPATATPRTPTPARPPASHGAATLPAVKQPSRPSITPASVVSRPLPPEQRNRDNTDAIEVYAPAPPSVEPPPGERAERPGQYSMSRRAAGERDVPMREMTGRIAIPAGLGRPRPPQPAQPGSGRTGSPSSQPVPQPAREGSERTRAPSSQSDGVPRAAAPQPANAPRSAPHLTAPISSRTGTGTGNSPSNVITTRPAVIVGAPSKPAATTPPRVRKAREDEGRGFGQGLISEKSLDEVILAYLSEDAEDK